MDSMNHPHATRHDPGLDWYDSTERQAMLEANLIDTTGKTLWELICERAERTPDKRMAIDERGRTLTYGEYRR